MNLALFLSYRMKSLNGALDFLPSLIRATVDKLTFFAGSSSTTTTEAWTEIVTKIMVAHGSYVINLAVAPSPHQHQDLDNPLRINYIALAAAVYNKNDSIVAAMLRAEIDPWGQSNVLGSSVYAAAGADSAPIMEMLLMDRDVHEANEDYDERRKLQSRILISSLKRATHKGNWAVAAALLTMSSERSIRLPRSYIRSWTKGAVAADNYGFLSKLRQVGYLSKDVSEYANEIISGLDLSHNPEPTLRFCIQEKLLYARETRIGRIADRLQHLLSLAVSRRNVLLAKAALAVNAHTEHPVALRTAIKNHDLTMVQLLLDNGVDPEAKADCPAEQSTCELACSMSEIYEELKRAIHQKMKALGKDYRFLRHLVGVNEGGEAIYVAYTFHRP